MQTALYFQEPIRVEFHVHGLCRIHDLLWAFCSQKGDTDTWPRQRPSNHELRNRDVELVSDAPKLIKDILSILPSLSLKNGVSKSSVGGIKDVITSQSSRQQPLHQDPVADHRDRVLGYKGKQLLDRFLLEQLKSGWIAMMGHGRELGRLFDVTFETAAYRRHVGRKFRRSPQLTPQLVLLGQGNAGTSRRGVVRPQPRQAFLSMLDESLGSTVYHSLLLCTQCVPTLCAMIARPRCCPSASLRTRSLRPS